MPISDTVSLLIPARNEDSNIAACLTAATATEAVTEILLLDDGSTDDTLAIARTYAAEDSRLKIKHRPSDHEVPSGWLGKSWACAELAAIAQGTVLVFVDADVRLEPTAIIAAVSMLRELQLDLLSPYPRQLATGWVARLVQPLLQWSWLTFVPLAVSERSTRSSLAVANGQFLVVDAQAYHSAGGHRGVRGEVIEDLALARAIRTDGGHTSVVDGSEIATCQMYANSRALIDGYAKSLWSAFSSGPRCTAVLNLLDLAYVIPPLAVIVGPTSRIRAIGLVGYAAAVAGRINAATVTGARVLPDSFFHPLSMLAFSALVSLSWRRRMTGAITWKDRELPGNGARIH